MTRPRILHLVSTGQIGGSEKHAASLVRLMDSERFEIGVVLFRPGPLVDSFAESNRTIVLDKKRRIDPKFAWKLTHVLQTERPDLIHTWNSTANLWGGLVAKLLGFPHLVSEEELGDWKGITWKVLDRVLGRWAFRVVGNADAVCRAAAERGVPSHKLMTISNAASTSSSTPSDRDNNMILLLARLDPRKGHDVLLHALVEIRREVPNAHLIFAGAAAHPAEKRFDIQLRDLTERLNLKGRVQFLGGVGDPWPLLARAGVAVCASYTEGSPNALLEAIAAETPVVSTHVGGIPEFLEDGTTALLVPPGDPGALATAIISCLNDPQAARTRSARAKEVLEKRFAPEEIVEQWAQLYNEALARR